MRQLSMWPCRGNPRSFIELIALVAVAGLAGGCAEKPYLLCEAGDCEAGRDEPAVGVQSCDLKSFEGAPEGICIPHVDAGWHIALVKMAPPGAGALDCPASAEWAGLWGEEVPVGNAEARQVIGCSVNPLATCSSLSWACVPFERDYRACVHQAGPQDCPGPYLIETTVEQRGDGGEVTVCCQDPASQEPG